MDKKWVSDPVSLGEDGIRVLRISSVPLFFLVLFRRPRSNMYFTYPLPLQSINWSTSSICRLGPLDWLPVFIL